MGIRMKTLGVVDNDRFALCALKAYLDQTLDGITLAWMTEHANTAIARCVTGERPDVLLVDSPWAISMASPSYGRYAKGTVVRAWWP